MIDQFYRENYPEYILTSMANYFNKREEAKMPDQGIAQIIFPDSKDLETFLKEQGSYDLHEDLLKYGLTTKQFYTLTIR